MIAFELTWINLSILSGKEKFFFVGLKEASYHEYQECNKQESEADVEVLNKSLLNAKVMKLKL